MSRIVSIFVIVVLFFPSLCLAHSRQFVLTNRWINKCMKRDETETHFRGEKTHSILLCEECWLDSLQTEPASASVSQSLRCVQLFLTPWTLLLGSFVHGILQARILEGAVIPFSRESSWPWSSPSLLYCRWILCFLSHRGSPYLHALLTAESLVLGCYLTLGL